MTFELHSGRGLLLLSLIAPPPFLLVGQTDSVYSLSLNRDMSMYTKDVLLSDNIKGLRVIEFDPWNDFLYWLSSHSKTIMRTKLDGEKVFFVYFGAHRV